MNIERSGIQPASGILIQPRFLSISWWLVSTFFHLFLPFNPLQSAAVPLTVLFKRSSTQICISVVCIPSEAKSDIKSWENREQIKARCMCVCVCEREREREKERERERGRRESPEDRDYKPLSALLVRLGYDSTRWNNFPKDFKRF